MLRSLKRPATLTALFAVAVASAWGSASQMPDAREIARRMHDADTSADGERIATMMIERGSQRLVRELSLRHRKYGDDERSIIRFLEPADVRDTQFLSWTYEATEREDDLWVFFPTENLVRRISGGGKKGSFMRSDFANEDIERRAVDDDTHRFVEATTLDGRDVYVIESRPIPAKAGESNYAMRRVTVDAQRWLPLKIEYHDRRGRLLKQLSQGGIERIGGIWTATKLIMETPRRKSRTLMQYTDVRYDIGLADAEFDQTALKR